MKAPLKPVISVLLPAHNAERYLVEAVDSILTQSFRHFELLVVDDGSDDSTPALLKALVKKDSRVKFWRLPRNRGRSYGLNFLIAKSRGRYLARMDGDDVALPTRFAKQVAALDADPGLGALSSAMWLWNGGSRRRYSGYPLSHDSIKASMAFQNSFSHPAMMIRRSALGASRYLVGWETEDYELWCRLILKIRFQNLAQPLLNYRVHATQSGSGRPLQQFVSAGEVRRRYLTGLGFRVSDRQAQLHEAVCLPFPRRRLDWLPAVLGWLLELRAQNQALGAFEPESLQGVLEERFGHYCSGLGLVGTYFYAARGKDLRTAKFFSPANAKAWLKYYLRPGPDRWA